MFKLVVTFTIVQLCGAAVDFGQKFNKQTNLTSYIPKSGYILEYFTAGSSVECSVTCLTNFNCTTFFYDKSTTRCQIHDSLPDDIFSMAVAPSATCYSLQVNQTGGACANVSLGFEFGGIYYFTIDVEGLDFNSSVLACGDNGGEIVKIENNAQNAFIQTVLDMSQPGSYYIGANDITYSKDYRWFDKDLSPVTFDDWDFGHPTNTLGNCVVMYQPNAWKWQSTNCSAETFVVCQL